MREDQNGNPCPETLGDYYDLFSSIYGVGCPACRFLKERIDLQGNDEPVIADERQMITLLANINKSGVVT